MTELWSNLKSEDIYVERPLGPAISLLSAISIYDTAPGLETLKNILARWPDGFKKKVSVSAVDVETGEKVTFTDKSVAFDDFHTAVIASASVPVAFPPT